MGGGINHWMLMEDLNKKTTGFSPGYAGKGQGSYVKNKLMLTSIWHAESQRIHY